MRRGRIAFVLVLLTFPLAGCGLIGDDDVDRDSYVRKNLELLASLPVYPGAKEMHVNSDLTRVELHTYTPLELGTRPSIKGYVTATTYRPPRGTTADQFARFYEQALRARRTWRLWLWMEHSEQNRCYARAGAVVCVRGFTIRVDHRGREISSS